MGIQINAGGPTLSLTGMVGTVYSIQYADDFSPTNTWVDRTLVQARGDGGVWFYAARYCRSARRFNHLPTYTYSGLGFRVVLAPGQP